MPDHLTPNRAGGQREEAPSPDDGPRIAGHAASHGAQNGLGVEAKDLDEDVRAFIYGLGVEALEEDDHLEGEQLIAYVRGLVDEVERTVAAAHMEVCAMCAREARALEAFKEEIAAPIVPPTPATQLSQLTRMLTRSGGLIVTRLGFAAGFSAALIVAVLVSLPIWRGRVSPQQARLEQTSAAERAVGDSLPTTPSAGIAPQPFVPDAAAGVSDKESEPKSPTGEGRQNSSARQPSSPPAQARHVVVINGGKVRVALAAPGQLRSVVAAALASGRVETAALDGVASRPGVTLKGAGEEARFEVLSPVGTAIMTDQPLFRWKAVDGATRYAVTVVKRGQVQVASSGMVYSTEWRPPAGLLRPGMIYRWGVVAMLTDGSELSAPGASAPEARFKIIEPERAERVKRLAARHSRSPLTLGVLFAQEGLIDDAERQFELLVKKNPRSEVARKLLQSVRGLRIGADVSSINQ